MLLAVGSETRPYELIRLLSTTVAAGLTYIAYKLYVNQAITIRYKVDIHHLQQKYNVNGSDISGEGVEYEKN